MIGKYKGPRLDNWGTPPSIIDALKATVGINFDLASNGLNAKCEDFFEHPFADALNLAWPTDRICFLNPPFSQANAFFWRAAIETSVAGVKLVALYKSNNMETETWQKWILPHANSVLLLNRRTAFVPPSDYKGDEHGPGFSCALIFYNLTIPRELMAYGTPICRLSPV
jgi:phage N-6-adenine-methyltransferase